MRTQGTHYRSETICFLTMERLLIRKLKLGVSSLAREDAKGESRRRDRKTYKEEYRGGLKENGPWPEAARIRVLNGEDWAWEITVRTSFSEEEEEGVDGGGKVEGGKENCDQAGK